MGREALCPATFRRAGIGVALTPPALFLTESAFFFS